MRKHRIEVRAFRRQVTIYPADNSCGATNPSASRDESWPISESADRKTIGLGEIGNASLEDDALEFLRKALDEGEGNRIVSAEKGGLNKSGFQSKLRSLALSIRNLKRLLNPLRRSGISDKS